MHCDTKTYFISAPLFLEQPSVTEETSSSSLATVIVKWSVPPVNIYLAQYYIFQVQYRQPAVNWINVTDFLNFTTYGAVNVTSLTRNRHYEFRIVPFRRQNNAIAIDSASNITSHYIRKYEYESFITTIDRTKGPVQTQCNKIK